MKKIALPGTLLVLLISLLLLGAMLSWAQPTGVDITYNDTDIPLLDPASEITTPGGSFTTMVLSGTFQTPRWKAYVGNITGGVTLTDSGGSTIYDWTLETVSGQVYVSRNSSVDWGTIGCVSDQGIADEQSFLNISESSVDSINRTFNDTVHRGFFVGTGFIANSTCRAIATYVDDAPQAPSEDATFQEILLEDGSGNLVFTTILESAATGYDSGAYDFQLIVPENPVSATPTTYYFFAEIS